MIENKLTFIENELKKFNVTDVAISELSDKYMPLLVNGIDDKEGLKVVNAARKVVKGYRIDIDKRRKELNADALEYQRRINGEAKRIIALLEPIESHLESQEKKISEEIERIKREKEQEESARYESRMKELFSLKFRVETGKFITDYLDGFTNQRIEIATLHLKQWDDSTFKEFIDNAKHYFNIYQKEVIEKMQREEAEKQALIQQRREQEIEAERLADIARKQEEKEASLKAEAARLAYLKSKEEVMQPCDPTCEAPIHNDERPIIVIKHDQIKIEDAPPEPEFSEVDAEYQPHTPEEIKAYQEGFDLSVIIVMNTINNEIEETENEEHKNILRNLKDNIESELDYLRNGD